MLTTLSIMSLDQGKLRPMNEAEDDYFARLTKSEKTEKARNLLATLRLVQWIWPRSELAMAHQLMVSAMKKWRNRDGQNRLPENIMGLNSAT